MEYFCKKAQEGDSRFEILNIVKMLLQEEGVVNKQALISLPVVMARVLGVEVTCGSLCNLLLFVEE